MHSCLRVIAVASFGIASIATAQSEPDPHGAAFFLFWPQTLGYKDGPQSVVAWNIGISMRPQDSVPEGSSTLAGYAAFGFQPGVQVAGTSGPATPFIGAGASLLSASTSCNPKDGKTTRVSASGFGGWANAGIRFSPDDTLEVGVVATYLFVDSRPRRGRRRNREREGDRCPGRPRPDSGIYCE